MKLRILALGLALISTATLAVAGPAARKGDLTEDFGAWLVWVAQGDLTGLNKDWKYWRFWFDAQLRRRSELESQDLLLLRPGLGYAFSKRWTGYLGYAWLEGHPTSGTTYEHRTWEQMQWKAPIGDWTVISRSRLEQRFFEDRGDVGARFRQMFRTTAPVFGVSSPFLAASDEVFVDLNETSWGQNPGLRQNRAFLGLGWFLNKKKSISLEFGYMNQWIDRDDTDRMNHLVTINLYTNF